MIDFDNIDSCHPLNFVSDHLHAPFSFFLFESNLETFILTKCHRIASCWFSSYIYIYIYMVHALGVNVTLFLFVFFLNFFCF